MIGHSPAPTVGHRARAGRPRDHDDAADRGRRWSSARSCAGGSACRCGSSPCRPPTPTGTRSATPATSPAGRKVVVHDYCYHGCVDETFATLDAAGRTVARRGNIGPPVDPAETTDGRRVQRRRGARAGPGQRRRGRRAVEPALTNVGIVLPEPGYHDALRELTRRARRPADHRRDAHPVGRARRLHRRRTASSPTS